MKKPAVVFHAAPTSRAAPATGLAAASVLLAWMLSGCMSMSGLSGSSSYACKAPDGVTCQSVSGTRRADGVIRPSKSLGTASPS